MIHKDTEFYKAFQELKEREKATIIMHIGASLAGNNNPLLDECLKMMDEFKEGADRNE